jgi:type II secretory pathway pseudopilin PulG
MLNSPRYKKKYLAFSLLEVSVVIMIVGILISGISAGIDLYQDYRLTNAKSLTTNSRVSRIEGLEMWIEPTLDNAFSKVVSTSPISYELIKKPDNNQPIGKWNNVNFFQKIATEVDPYQEASGRQPFYIESAINGLPALYFDGKTDGTGDFMSFKAKFINDYSNFTIFIVEKRTGLGVLSTNPVYTSIYQYILSTNDAGNIAVGPISNGSIRINPGSWYFVGNHLNKTYLHTFLINETAGKKIYLNGIEKLSVADTTKATVPANNFLIKIAYFDRSWTQNYYTGFIGEIIIFSKELNNSERSDIEKYLLDKWQIVK